LEAELCGQIVDEAGELVQALFQRGRVDLVFCYVLIPSPAGTVALPMARMRSLGGDQTPARWNVRAQRLQVAPMRAPSVEKEKHGEAVARIVGKISVEDEQRSSMAHRRVVRKRCGGTCDALGGSTASLMTER